MAGANTTDTAGWVLHLGRVEYRRVLEWQRGLVRMRREGFARDTIILVEHPPVVTVGRDGHEEHFKELKDEAVLIERGGDVTYHGPGQLVVYFIFNLTRRGRNLRKFMDNIQLGVIDTLADFGVTARQDDTNTGVWVGEHKIASIGIAVKNWITFHGAAINISTDLSQFAKIVPCGLRPEVMTSLQKETGRDVTLQEFGEVLMRKYAARFRTFFYPISLEDLAEDIESQAGGYEV
jgi:lipoate-protein ligase B